MGEARLPACSSSLSSLLQGGLSTPSSTASQLTLLPGTSMVLAPEELHSGKPFSPEQTGRLVILFMMHLSPLLPLFCSPASTTVSLVVLGCH